MSHSALFSTALLSIALATGDVAAETSTTRFLEGLLDRRLYTLAERYCQDQLQREGLAARRHVELSVELSRTYAQWALNSPPLKQPEFWQKSHAAIDQLLQQSPDNPYAVLARRQDALVHLARGQLARYEAKTSADPQPQLQAAQVELQQAVRALEKVFGEVTDRLDELGGRPPRQGSLTSDQLRILQKNVRFELARALLNQALCYEPGSPDRINALGRAESHFRGLAIESSPIDWRSRVALLRCLREMRQVDELRELSEKYLEMMPPQEIESGIRVELARQHMADREYQKALMLLGSTAPRSGRIAAEWDFAELEILLAVAGAERDPDAIAQWRQRAVNQVEKIEARHGPYWMRRAEGLMGRHIAAVPGSNNLDILARAASGLFRAGKIDEALEAYDRARQQAHRSGQTSRAFQLGYTAAMIQHDRQQYAVAAERFQALALENVDHPRAADAHLMAVFDIAQQIRQQSVPDVQSYVDALKEHLDNWPSEATANQARFWLGRVYQSQRNWQQAVNVLRGIQATSEHFYTALSVATSCYGQWFDMLSAQQDPGLADLAAEAADHFERIARRLLDAPTADNASAMRLAAAQSARFRMQYAGRGFEQAEHLLTAVLEDQPDATPEQLTQLRILLVYALAAQPSRLDEARKILGTVAGSSPDNLLILIDGIREALNSAAPAARTTLADLQLRCVAMLKDKRKLLSPAARLDMDLAEAESLVAAGRRAEALTAYKALANSYPANGDIQVGYAALLLAGPDRDAWQMALSKWREIERRSRPKSARWFLAKYSQARAHRQLGNSNQAARIIKLTRTLHPELGGPDMQSRFLKLLELCEAAN